MAGRGNLALTQELQSLGCDEGVGMTVAKDAAAGRQDLRILPYGRSMLSLSGKCPRELVLRSKRVGMTVAKNAAAACQYVQVRRYGLVPPSLFRGGPGQ